MAVPLFLAVAIVALTSVTDAAYRGPVTLADKSQLWYDANGSVLSIRLLVNSSVVTADRERALWVGVGLAAPGSAGMRGADLLSATFSAGVERCAKQDRHAPFVREPRTGLGAEVLAPVDRVADDSWRLVECKRGGDGAVTLEVTRQVRVATGNRQDGNVTADRALLHAYAVGGFAHHGANRYSSPLALVDAAGRAAPTPTPTPTPKSAATFVFKGGALRNAGNNLTCYTAQLPADAASITAIVPKVESAAITRIVLYGCADTPLFADVAKLRRTCAGRAYTSGRHTPAQCNTAYYVWAPGVGPLLLPRNVGFAASDLNRRLLMEVTVDGARGRYAPPQLTLHYERRPRKHRAGTLWLGMAETPLSAIAANQSLACSSRCTSLFRRPLNVFAAQAALGPFGRAARIRLRPNGDEFARQRIVADVPYWAPHLQRRRTYDPPYRVAPNSSLFLDCQYPTQSLADADGEPQDVVRFGRRSVDARCDAQLYYWPAQREAPEGDLFYCGLAISQRGEQFEICGSGWRAKEDVCFPADATVSVVDKDGERSVPMHQLRVGNVLRTATGPSPVFMFTHRKAAGYFRFVSLRFDGGELSLTASHHLFLNGRLQPAADARVGDLLELGDGRHAPVIDVRTVVKRGLYNPQTVSGTIVVNGVKASTYTTSVPPMAAHSLLRPLSAVFRLLGVDATAGFFDDLPLLR